MNEAGRGAIHHAEAMRLFMEPNNDLPFEILIADLMNPGNENRRQAEAIFNSFRQHHPDALVLKLIHTLRSCAQAETRAMCAVLLRKQLDKKSSVFLWPRLSPATRTALKAKLLLCLQREETWSVIKKLCYTVVELATVAVVASWPELVVFMFRCVSSESPRLKESALNLFAELCDYLHPYVVTLHSVFQECLAPASAMDVRVAALVATAKFTECLDDIEIFQDLVLDMLQVLIDALSKGDEAATMEVLDIFVELAGSEPRFLLQEIDDIIDCMLQIAKADVLEEETRHLAVEFLVALAEAGGLEEGTRRIAVGVLVGLAEDRDQRQNLPHEFVGRLFAALMEMLRDIEDDPMWHAAGSDDGDAGETSNCEVGQDCLDRLAMAVGGEAIVPHALELLSGCLADPDWRKRHAGLITLAQIAEGCAKEMRKNLEHVVTMVLSLFHDLHARVRWAAIHAIGILSTDLSPDFQHQQYEQVIPALAGAMDDFKNPRVQAHATAAMFNFSENCTPDILAPYLDGIVGRLLILLQNGKKMVQEVALMALASIADSSKEHFLKCYDNVMPYLKAILAKATEDSNQMLSAKSMECINLVGMAVGKDKFRHDAKEVMEMLMTIQRSQIDADDSTMSYMFHAWERLCKCLGQEFLPYMSAVMPPLIRSAQLNADATIAATDPDEVIDGSNDESVEIVTLDKFFGVKTAVLEEKAIACNMICCYARELKEGFYPWIEQVVPTLVPLLKFYFHEEIRKAAASAMPLLLRSTQLAVEKRQAQGRDETYIKQLSDYIIPSLVEALHKEPNTKICSSLLDSLNECMEVSGILLDQRQVKSIVEEFKKVITESRSRKRECIKRIKAEDFDAEEMESLEEKIDQEQDVFMILGECIGTLIKTFKLSFLPFFDELLSYITPMLGKDKEKIIAICIFDDVAEQCGEAATKYYDTFFPFLLEACNDADAGVRQAAVYGIGICAEFGGFKVKPMIGEALLRLNMVTSQPHAHDTSNIMATDNAVSALGKICQFHRDIIDVSQIIPAWLDFLPIKGDLIEAKVVHEQLCLMVERSDTEILGPSNQFLPKIVAIFTEVLCAGKDLVAEQTAGRMVNLLRRLQQTLPPSAFTSTLSALQPQQQLALQSILSSLS